MSLPDEKKLRWMCRRGLLELDLVLTKILDEKYANLTEEQKVFFIELLEEPDNDLLGWLLNQTPPPDEWSEDKKSLLACLNR
jgi:antitoxin CptB